MRNKQVTR